MRKRHFILGLLAVCLGVSVVGNNAFGQDQKPAAESVPPIVFEGLDALRQFGPDDADKVWSKGSSWEGSSDRSLASALKTSQEILGAYRSFEILSVRPVSSTTRIVYLTLNYEKGPRFARFDLYQTGHGWILLHCRVDGDADWLRAELR